MAGILTRFKDIMSSNVNALLDKCENPEKMIDQTVRNLNKDLNKVKGETAAVMAEETRAKRKLDDITAEVAKLQDYAVKAITAGNDDDARKFLEEKSKKEVELNTLSQSYEMASLNAKRMRAMHDKLESDVKTLEAKKADLKAKFAAAKAQERINKMVNSTTGGADSISAFEKYEEKANQAFDKASAMAQLNADGDDEMDDLVNKYSNTSTKSVDDELAALKASLKK